MRRRNVLKATAATAVPLLSPTAVVAQSDRTLDETEAIAKRYFDELENLESKDRRQQAAIGCANELCRSTKDVQQETLEAIVGGTKSADNALRRVRLGLEILDEQQITTAVEPSMVAHGREELRQLTRYIPLLGSFNNLRAAACSVSPDNPKSIENFYYAALAFGLEVALWQIGAPYKMAWRGTRFVSNRTFLRFARHGCDRCIAFAMSELHWALRGGIYGDVVEKNKVEFVVSELHQLQEDARRWDYKVDIDADRESVESTISEVKSQNGGGGAPVVGEREDSGFLSDILSDLPEIPDISLPELPDISILGFLGVAFLLLSGQSQ